MVQLHFTKLTLRRAMKNKCCVTIEMHCIGLKSWGF